MDPETTFIEPPKKAKRKKKRAVGKSGGGLEPRHHQVHVNVNVVNSAGDSNKKKGNDADDALRSLRGY